MSSKKTIALNTIYLYLSSFFQLVIGLYTSRILLQALGIEDFGLYGVVGSIVTLLGFLNLALGSASSRYLTYELAKGNQDSQRKVYSSVFCAHLILAVCFVLLSETIGLWYLCYKLETPYGRMTAAHWVYQSAILIGVINILQVPYNALINAHEQMKFSSFWVSFNNLLKFLGVLLLYYISFDKLIFYAIVTFAFSLIGFIGFFVYCKRKFSECKLIRFNDRSLFKEILSFAAYSAFSSSSTLIRTQGASLLINKFFGVAINASANIANMISGYITSFSYNVVQAFRPQIVKSYAIHNIEEMQTNVNQCIKFCIAIFSMTAIPISVEIDYLLYIWLGVVPKYSALFCLITVWGNMFALINLVMISAIQATSKVKKNSQLISYWAFCSLGVTFLLLILGMKAYIVFLVYSLTELLNVITSMANLKRLIPDFYMKKTIVIFLHLVFLILLASMGPIVLKLWTPSSLCRLILVTISYVIVFNLLFWHVMLERGTRNIILNKIFKKHDS